jgi:hypothetical protein
MHQQIQQWQAIEKQLSPIEKEQGRNNSAQKLSQQQCRCSKRSCLKKMI